MIIRRSASLEKLHFSKRKSLFNLKNACGNRKGKCEENSWEKLHQIKSRAQVHVFDTIEVVHIKSILILVRGLILRGLFLVHKIVLGRNMLLFPMIHLIM